MLKLISVCGNSLDHFQWILENVLSGKVFLRFLSFTIATSLLFMIVNPIGDFGLLDQMKAQPTCSESILDGLQPWWTGSGHPCT